MCDFRLRSDLEVCVDFFSCAIRSLQHVARTLAAHVCVIELGLALGRQQVRTALEAS